MLGYLALTGAALAALGSVALGDDALIVLAVFLYGGGLVAVGIEGLS